jgi:hypothetical protein
MTGRKWRTVTKRSPCTACGKPDWCAWTPDGERLKCERTVEVPAGMELVEPRDGGALFRFPRQAGGPRTTRSRARATSPPTGIDWQNESTRLQAKLSAERRAKLAHELGVARSALEAIRIGWAEREDLHRYRAGGEGWSDDYPAGAFAFPERDGRGRVVGLSFRTLDGRKGAPHSDTGARRGLVVPTTLATTSDLVLLVEGATDVAAAVSLGLAAVGRPSNAGGVDDLAQLLRGLDVLVVGERDQKASGQWPGRDGAAGVATRLGTEWQKAVDWVLPPDNAKDVRAWLQDRVAHGLDLQDRDACRRSGQTFVAVVTKDIETAEPERRTSQAELLVRLAHEHFRIGQGADGDPFAVEIGGANVALSLRGPRGSLGSRLASLYRSRYRATPSSSALSDAMIVLQGDAQAAAPETVHLRVAEHEGAIVIDIGENSGRAIVVGPAGWRVVERSPVLFRRTALSGAMPLPEHGGSVAELWTLLNVAEDDRALLLGWIVAAFMPEIAHAILLLGGEQGTGKTWVLLVLVALVSPSPAPHRSQPRDVEEWAVPVSGCWCSAFDNVSTIPQWWSDLLCKGSTGDGFARRRLYSDGDLAVLAFRRILILTSIDAGALRGDLGDRVLLVDLERIAPEKRLTETALRQRLSACHARLLGAVLDVVASVLAHLPNVLPERLPRMADFARILAAMDAAIDTDALARYAAQGSRIAEEVLDGDPVGERIQVFVRTHNEWHSTAGELLESIQTPELKAARGWPRNARGLGARLRRLSPALRAVGIEVTPPARTDKTRRWLLRVTGGEADSSAQTAQSPDGRCDDIVDPVARRAVESNVSRTGPSDSPSGADFQDRAQHNSGLMGDPGGSMRHISDDPYAAAEREAIQRESFV